MLKGFCIWRKLTTFPQKLILLILFVLEIPFSVFFHKRYDSFLHANSWMTESLQLLLFAFCVFYFAGILFRMAQKEMEDFGLIAYWTALSKGGCYTYVTCTLLPWMELGLFLALTFGSYNCMHPLGIVMCVFGMDLFFIQMGVCYAKRKSIQGKSQKMYSTRKGFLIKAPLLQLMVMSIKRRLRCWDVTAMMIGMNIVFIVLCQVIKGNILLVVSVLFMVFLYLTEDRFYENEGMNFTYYKEMGIPFQTYLGVQVCSSILYSEVPILLFLAINSKNILQILLFVLLLFVFSFYWNVSFIYNESRNQSDRFLKFWYEIISLWISVIPAINMIWIYRKYKKIKKEWNHD